MKIKFLASVQEIEHFSQIKGLSEKSKSVCSVMEHVLDYLNYQMTILEKSSTLVQCFSKSTHESISVQRIYFFLV